MLQLALTVSIYLLIVIPAGVYLYHIAAGKHTFADPVFDRVDGAIYKISGVDPGKGMNWKQYALALLGTNAVMVFIGYLILRVQSAGLFNPNNIENMEPTLAFNTIISFMTNTNLQHYSGESGLSYLSQMLVIIFMMFVSAASGYAACVAFIRGLAGRTKNDVGNFFADLCASPPVSCCRFPLWAACCWYGRACRRILKAMLWWRRWRAHFRSLPWAPSPRWRSSSIWARTAAASWAQTRPRRWKTPRCSQT